LRAERPRGETDRGYRHDRPAPPVFDHDFLTSCTMRDPHAERPHGRDAAFVRHPATLSPHRLGKIQVRLIPRNAPLRLAR
jgi:hypothetical protein